MKSKPNAIPAARSTRKNNQGLPQFTLTAMAAASLLCFSNIAAAAPGKPSLKQYEITSIPHGFVEINLQNASGASPYKDIVKLNKKVNVPLPFDIWSNGSAVKAAAVIDGEIDPTSEVRMSAGSTQSGQVVANVKTPGKKKMQVRVFDADGNWTDSDPLMVTVFDTVPELADDLPDNVDKKNKKFTQSTDAVVGTYFTSWSVYARNFSVDKVPLDNLTHILYGFVPICGADTNEALRAAGQPYQALQQACAGLPDFSVAIHDSWAEIGKTLPGQTMQSPLKGVLGQMMAAKKKNPNLKILPSIGGWTLSDPFFRMHDPAKRKVFVDSVENFLRTWKFFDGVDIDWEFPGGKGATPSLGNAQTDGQLYVTLMKELRQRLDKLSKEFGKTYQLTSAIGAPPEKVNVIDYKQATQYMDYLFDMTYDYYGAWDLKELGHQTALYAPKNRPDTKFTTHNSVEALLKQGIDPKKIVVGAAMYGRGWTGVSGYKDGNPFTGVAKGPHAGQWEKGILDYKKIASDMLGPDYVGIRGYEYNYDQAAEAPYLFNKSTGDLITFDDARSVQAKGAYVRKNQLGGLFSWEIDADNGDILNAMNKGLGHEEGGSSGNHPPVAVAVANMRVEGPAAVTLDASKSRDPDGDKLTFRWEQIQGDALKITNASSAQASVAVPAVASSKQYTFRVTVSDPAGLKDTAQTTVTVSPKKDDPDKPDPKPPVARLSGPAVAEAGQSVVLSAAKSSSSSGAKLSYSWVVPQGVNATQDGPTLSFKAPELDKDQAFTFSVNVKEGKLVSTAKHTVQVKKKSSSEDDGGGGKYPAYKPGVQYGAGSIVSNAGKTYQCKPFPYSGWCSAAPSAYEPGKGFAWTDAWTVYGGESSGGKEDDTGGKTDDGKHSPYKEGTKYAPGQVVANNGKLYRCKPFPYANWCSMAAWAYEPGKGSAWNQAWEEYKQ
ncbi:MULTISPECIES: glycosyl hydrolase family 18 protein [unclassified Herbaspirillum]|uniref:glycosyl hydrolase family 18 protein n=1 Tax=unclassified Herbaspirillum TaxID=2624150 RepID=UPI00180555F0|nr:MULTISPECIES: glycosyl hydrolase family 18 protein [unclassified Herbaspirillum]MBB5390554.1 chitinase [Herbaspirillum sp. SJZ102]